jgi:prepilin-type N-terminal cleavage/methylation domain-containing protein
VPSPRRSTTPSPRGFTVIELLLALALAAVITTAAFSLFMLLGATDRRLAVRFDEDADLSIAQQVIRRAMGSLVAARPREPSPTDRPAPKDGEEADGPDTEARERARSELEELIGTVTGDEAFARSLTENISIDRPNFELYFDTTGPGIQPVLEVKVMESPVPPAAPLDSAAAAVEQFLPVRGVFETVQTGEGLVLQWRQLEPPGPPTVLLRRLAAVEWFVLPRARHGKKWTDVHAAYIQEWYPVAVRLVLWTESGTHVDWLFDTAVTTPEWQ